MNNKYMPEVRVEIDGQLMDVYSTVAIAKAIVRLDRAELNFLRTVEGFKYG